MTAGKHEDYEREGDTENEIERRVGAVETRVSLQRTAHGEVHDVVVVITTSGVVDRQNGTGNGSIGEDPEFVDEETRDVERRADD